MYLVTFLSKYEPSLQTGTQSLQIENNKAFCAARVIWLCMFNVACLLHPEHRSVGMKNLSARNTFQKLFSSWPALAAWQTQTSCPVKELPVREQLSIYNGSGGRILCTVFPGNPTLQRAAAEQQEGGKRKFSLVLWRRDEGGRKKSARRGDNEVTQVIV